MGGRALFALYIYIYILFFQSSMLVLIPIPFRGQQSCYFFYFFNQYQVGPTTLLNNMNSLNSLLQVAWYWDIYIYIYFFFVFCVGGQRWYFRSYQLKNWRKCIFSPYILAFFLFSPYILFLPLLVPKPINAFHFRPFRQSTVGNS